MVNHENGFTFANTSAELKTILMKSLEVFQANACFLTKWRESEYFSYGFMSWRFFTPIGRGDLPESCKEYYEEGWSPSSFPNGILASIGGLLVMRLVTKSHCSLSTAVS